MPTQSTEQPSYAANRKTRLPFLTLTQGTRRIRILDEKALGFFTHYLKKQKITLHCPGKDCPICKVDQQIYLEDNKEFRKNENYTGLREIFLVNVLDLTVCKTCPECGTDNYSINDQFSPTCSKSKCNSIITEVEAKESNKVKILMQGKKLFDALNEQEKTVTEDNPDLTSWTQYEWKIKTTGTGREVERIATPLPAKTSPISEEVMEQKAILSTILLDLVPDEILQVQRGVSLKDIFAARNATAEPTGIEKVLSDEEKETKNLVEGLMTGEVKI